MRLVPVTKISIPLLMDNVIDILLSKSPHVHRPPPCKEGKFLPSPLAEHGFSNLIETEGLSGIPYAEFADKVVEVLTGQITEAMPPA